MNPGDGKRFGGRGVKQLTGRGVIRNIGSIEDG